MIHKVGQIMLYVTDQDASVKFWIEMLGFKVIVDKQENGMRWIEIAPTEIAETSIILHDKKLIAEISPELNLGTPSLMFFSSNLEQLRNDLVSKNVIVGEIVDRPSGKVFNFADNDNNYFAVMETR